MVSKILVANRGEIAIRAFRAAYELGIATVAVFPYEDRNSEHRLKADEAYQIGEPGHPVRAYLDPGLIVEAAVKAGADAVYPGYGFLSENPALAEACAAAGITFVGPDASVLTLTGNKARAIAAARAAGVPTLRSVAPGTDVDALAREARDLPFPVFVKAVAGGGGRGMRRVEEPGALREAIETCMREAEARVREPDRLHRAGRDRSPPHRGADPGRRRRRRDPPVRARLLGPAPPPEGHRDRARAASRRGPARADLRRRGAVRDRDRVRQRGHGRVPGRPVGQLRLHRDEPAHPGRAHRDRGDHRRRPGAGAAAHRRPARPWPTWGSRRTASGSAGPRCSAGSPPRTRPTASARTPA